MFEIVFLTFCFLIATSQAAPSEPIQCGVKGPSGASTVEGDLGIIGGQNAAPFEFPWQVSLQITGFGHYCGGSILNKRWIVTAAHCAKGYHPNDITAVAGAWNISNQTESSQVKVNVSRIFVFPNYSNPFFNDGDVALLKLDKDLPLSHQNKHLGAICLPEEESFNETDKYAGSVCTATGWGYLEDHSGKISPILQRVNITVTKQTVCSQDYKNEIIQITDKMICAADPGKDPCHGDSGGPLMCYIDGRWNLIGIISMGKNCAEQEKYPGVFARVSNPVLLSWIKGTIADNP